MPIWQLCANLLIPNCLRSNLSYSPLAALEFYVKKTDMSRIGVVVFRKYANLSKDDVFYRERMFILRWTNGSLPFAPSFKELAEIYDYPLAQYVINLPKERQIDGCHFTGLFFPEQLSFIVDHLLKY